jgi:hypothetical protein
MGMEDFQFLLGDLATAFRQDALWATIDPITRDYNPVATIPGRFRIDPFELPLGGHEPGLGETQIWFYCDRAIVPKPWPVLGDLLTINGQVYEIVQKDEDDIGEFGFRLIRQEIGISTVTSEGVPVTPIVQPLSGYERGINNRAERLRADAGLPPSPPVGPHGVPVVAAATNGKLQHAGRPSRRDEIAKSFNAAVAAGVIDPDRPLKELCAVMHQRLGNGGGLSNRTLRRVVGGLVRANRNGIAA